MGAGDFTLSSPSLPLLKPYELLDLRNPRRRELFAFLAEAVSGPNRVTFELDEHGLRWTRLESIGLVWAVDTPRREIDVVSIWELPE
jgi:hypothetical protein